MRGNSGKSNTNDTERIVDYIFRHLYRVSLLSPIYTPFMLLINISIGIWSFIAYRGVHPYIGLPAVFIILTTVMLLISYYLTDVAQVQRNQKRAEYIYNPVMNRSFTPFQQNQLIGIYLPILEYLHDNDKEKLYKAIERAKRWGDSGFIADNDVPEELKKYYKLKEDRI